MSSRRYGRLAAPLLLAFACNGEFRFDTNDRAETAGGAGPAAAGAGAATANGAAAGAASSSGAPAGIGGNASTGAGAVGGDTSVGAAAGALGGDTSVGGEAAGGMGDVGELNCGLCAEFGLFCSPDADGCVECRNNDDCPAANPYCELATHRCTPCTPTQGCDRGSVCDRWSYACLQSCATELDPDHDCSRSTHMCDTDRSVCVECLEDGDCSCNPHGPHCVHSTRCAECAYDRDCGTLGRFCDPVSFTCVVCRDSHDCGFPLVCDPSTHTCVGGEYHGGN